MKYYVIDILNNIENKKKSAEMLQCLSGDRQELIVTSWNETPLLKAFYGSNLEIIKFILNDKEMRDAWITKANSLGFTPLHAAVMSAVQKRTKESKEALDLLLTIPKLNINAKSNRNFTPLSTAERAQNFETKNRLLKYNKFTNGTIESRDIASDADLNWLIQLFYNGASLEFFNGNNLLHILVLKKRPDKLEEIFTNQNPEIKSKVTMLRSWLNNQGLTPEDLARNERVSLPIVSVPESPKHPERPLLRAIEKSDFDAVKSILGGDNNTRDAALKEVGDLGETPLFHAVQQMILPQVAVGKAESMNRASRTFSLLLTYPGLNINQKVGEGKTPLSIARVMRDDTLEKRLVKYNKFMNREIEDGDMESENDFTWLLDLYCNGAELRFKNGYNLVKFLAEHKKSEMLAPKLVNMDSVLKARLYIENPAYKNTLRIDQFSSQNDEELFQLTVLSEIIKKAMFGAKISAELVDIFLQAYKDARKNYGQSDIFDKLVASLKLPKDSIKKCAQTLIGRKYQDPDHEIYFSIAKKYSALYKDLVAYKNKLLTKKSKFANIAETAEAIEGLYACFELIKVLQRSADKSDSDSIKELEQFLAKRWDRIKATNVSYITNTESRINQCCIDMAETMLGNRVNDNSFQLLLMPTIDRECSQLITTATQRQSLKDGYFPLGSCLLTDDFRYLIDLDTMFAYGGDGQIRQTYLPGDYKVTEYYPWEKVMEISKEDKERIKKHISESSQFFENVDKYRLYLLTSTFAVRLGALIVGLRRGSVDRKGGGQGKEYDAGDAAYQEMINFKNYLEGLSKNERERYLDMTTEKGVMSLRKLWDENIARIDELNLQTVNKDNSAALCVNLNKDTLKSILEANYDKLYEINKLQAYKEAMQQSAKKVNDKIQDLSTRQLFRTSVFRTSVYGENGNSKLVEQLFSLNFKGDVILNTQFGLNVALSIGEYSLVRENGEPISKGVFSEQNHFFQRGEQGPVEDPAKTTMTHKGNYY